MTVMYVVRDTSGNILRTGHCQPGDLALQAKPGEVSEINTDSYRDDTHYHNGAGYSARGVLPVTADKTTLTADGVDKITFSNIPVGTRVDGVVINDGTLEFTTNSVGPDSINFIKTPEYKPFMFDVEGT